MAVAIQPELTPGRVYRTAALGRWGRNPTRLARRLEREGKLVRLGHGLYHAPRRSRFGAVPPTDEALLDAFLDGTPYVVTGPVPWNALRLGTTALHVRPLVYNTKRTGIFTLGNRTFDLRRVAFPLVPTPEWFAVDLMRHHAAAGIGREQLLIGLVRVLRRGSLDEHALTRAAEQFGTREQRETVREALELASA